MLNFMLADALAEAPLVLWYIGVLAFLEGLLSADNALVLALMVRHLPRKEQKRVLRYGIWGAVAFRFVAVLLSALLLKFWFFKVFGGLYLLYLAISHFLSRREQGPKSPGPTELSESLDLRDSADEADLDGEEGGDGTVATGGAEAPRTASDRGPAPEPSASLDAPGGKNG